MKKACQDVPSIPALRIHYNIYLSNFFSISFPFFQFFLLIIAVIFTILIFQTEICNPTRQTEICNSTRQTEICNSTRQTECKEIDVLSEQLRRVYYTKIIRIVEDIEVTVDIIEKIVGSITTYNIGKAPEVGYVFIKVLSQA